MATDVLFESATGLALFHVTFQEDIGHLTKAVQDATADLSRLGQLLKLESFVPFADAVQGLEVINDISEGVVPEFLSNFLELNLGGKKGVVLGVEDRTLAGNISSNLKISCDASDRTLELLRAIRLHAGKLLKGLDENDLQRAELGLGHAYSRAKVKFNVNRSDNMIIQAIAILDTLDKDVNTLAMRLREWYGWHFPELARLVPDHYAYAKIAHFIGDKKSLTGSDKDNLIGEISEILGGDSVTAENVADAARTSMGSDLSDLDLMNLKHLATRVIKMFDYRKGMQTYLNEKMKAVAPNLASLIGDVVGARLISHAGSLTNLAKYPASTLQILGAEKALFRALKTKGNTPKYGIIFNSSFIGRAGMKNKGRISRFLANKCSIASRIDCFSDMPSMIFGDALREQVEERLNFLATGEPTTRNSVVMEKASKELKDLMDEEDFDELAETAAEKVKSDVDKKEKKEKSKKSKKSKKDDDSDDSDDDALPETPSKSKKKSKDKTPKKNDDETPSKKSKKEKKRSGDDDDTPKKKKKRSSD